MCARPKSTEPSVLGYKILKYISDNGPSHQYGLAQALSRLERREINRDTVHRSWKRLAALGYLTESKSNLNEGDDEGDGIGTGEKGPLRMYGTVTAEGKKVLKKFLRGNS